MHIRQLTVKFDVWREDDTANVQLFWHLDDTEPFYTDRVGDPENLTGEEVEQISNAIELCRTFK
jgi:hypothetical protein